MEHIYHIRYEYFEKDKSIREISRTTGHARETVAKYVEQEDFSLPQPVKRKRRSKTDQYRDQVREWLMADETAPRKQRHSAMCVYRRLKKQAAADNKPFDVSDRAIRDLVADLRLELGQQKQASLPLLHPAGEAQVDFGTTYFYEKGSYYEGSHLALTLPHSDAKSLSSSKVRTSNAWRRA